MPNQYPREIDLKLRVYEDGRVEILNAPNTGDNYAEALKGGKLIKGHNSIGVLVSNPTCFIVNGKQYCY